MRNEKDTRGILWRPDWILRDSELTEQLGEAGIGYLLDENGPLKLLEEGITRQISGGEQCPDIRELLYTTIRRLSNVTCGGAGECEHDSVRSLLERLMRVNREQKLSSPQSFAVAVCFSANRGRPIDASVLVLLTKGVNVFAKVERMLRAMEKWGIEDEAFLARFPKRQ